TTGATALNTVSPDAGGVAHPSTSQTALAGAAERRVGVVGSNQNYNGPTGNCEPFTVGKVTLTIATTVHNDSGDVALTGNLPLGGGAHDSATVSGKVGSLTLPDVTFFFFAKGVTCTNGSTTRATALNTVSPDAGGVAHPSTSQTALAAGTYNFRAVVASHDNYTGPTRNRDPFSFGKVTLTTATSALSLRDALPISGNLPLGGGAHDSATVSGKVGSLTLPDVTFFFFAKGVTCTNGSTTRATALNTVSPDAGGVAHPSTSQTALAAGTYNFRAVVASHDNYTGPTRNRDPFSFGKVTLTTATSALSLRDALPISGNLPLGGGAHDSATVSGKVGSLTLPDVTFFFFAKGVTCTNGRSEERRVGNAGSPGGGGVAYPSTSQNALAAGRYNFMAVVASNDNYNGATGNCEPFTVGKVTLTIATTVHNDSGDVALTGNLPLGGGAHDSATVSGKVGSLTLPDVTFFFFAKGVTCTNG